jgi:hypothetical protein
MKENKRSCTAGEKNSSLISWTMQASSTIKLAKALQFSGPPQNVQAALRISEYSVIRLRFEMEPPLTKYKS